MVGGEWNRRGDHPDDGRDPQQHPSVHDHSQHLKSDFGLCVEHNTLVRVREARMKAVVRWLSVVAFVGALSPAVLAQWPAYPSGTVPKNAKGEPDHGRAGAANAGRQAGLQRSVARRADRRARHAGSRSPSGHAADRACSATSRRTFLAGCRSSPEFAAIKKKRQDNNSKDNPEAHCLPMGLMQFHTQGFPRKFIQTPKLLVILYEASYGIRQIFLDGRPLPEQRSAALVLRLLDRPLGRRHARRRDHRIPRRRLARHRRYADDRAGQDDRTVPARELRTDGDRHHD